MASVSEKHGGSSSGLSISPSSTTTITTPAGAAPQSSSSSSRHNDFKGKGKSSDVDETDELNTSYYASQKNSPSVILWQAWIWLAGTFPLSMLETWERALLAVFFGGLTFLIWYSLFFHFPDHVRHMVAKGTYYLYGKLSHPSSTAASAASQVSNSNTFAAVSQGINNAADAIVGQQRKRLTGEL